MKGRYLAENLYKSRIVNPIVAISAVGDSLDEYEILCETAPKYDKGWVFVDFDSSDTTKRDLIFFHKKKDKTIYYYRKNRDLLNTGAKNTRHDDGATIQMNDVSEWINTLSKNIDDFGFVEVKYDKATDLMVYGGQVNMFGVIKDIPDTKLNVNTTTDGKQYVFFDYAKETFELYKEEDLASKSGMRILEVEVKDGAISSTKDARAAQLSQSFSSSIFDIEGGNLVIKKGGITIETLSEEVKTKLDMSHEHTNKDVIDQFAVKDGKLFWGEKDFEALGEANLGENLGSGIGIFKDKYGVNLRFKTITGSNGISIVQQGDVLNIVGGMVTETKTDTFQGDGTQKEFVLSDEIYNTGLVWMSTEAGTNLVFNVDYTVGEDKKTITFTQAPMAKVFVNYIIRSELGLQTAGEANTASNIPSQEGVSLFNNKEGIDLKFNKIKAGDNVSLSQSADGNITISAVASSTEKPTIAITGIPEGAVDGVNKTYALPSTPKAPENLLIFKNGLLQKRVADFDIEGYTLTFTSAPIEGDEIAYELYTEVSESIARMSFNSTVETINKDWESIQVTTLLNTPKAGSLRVWVNGIYMLDIKDFKLVDGKLYIKNLLEGDEIQILYFYSLS